MNKKIVPKVLLPAPLLIGWFSAWIVRTRVTDLFECSFDEFLPLFSDVVVDGRHRLDRAGSGAGKGEFAVCDFTLVQCERAISQNYKAAICKRATFVLVEIKYYFFFGKIVFANFHQYFC